MLATEAANTPQLTCCYQFIENVWIGSTTLGAAADGAAGSVDALAETLFPATIARTAAGRRATRRKRVKRRIGRTPWV
jgi:hypothetical protein